MAEVWIVGNGEYSDQYNICVCPTKELAGEIAAAFGGWVVAVPFHESMPKIVDKLTLVVQVDEDGSTVGLRGAWKSGDPEKKPIREPWEYHELMLADLLDSDQFPCRHEVSGVHDFHGMWSVEVRVSGIDHVRVRKVLSEQVAMAKADWQLIVARAKSKDDG